MELELLNFVFENLDQTNWQSTTYKVGVVTGFLFHDKIKGFVAETVGKGKTAAGKVKKVGVPKGDRVKETGIPNDE